MPVSCVCSPQIRKKELAPLFVNLLRDQSRWVRMTAYQALGPFISTFADSQITALLHNDNGEIGKCCMYLRYPKKIWKLVKIPKMGFLKVKHGKKTNFCTFFRAKNEFWHFFNMQKWKKKLFSKFWCSLFYYKMNTDNDALLKFWFYFVV